MKKLGEEAIRFFQTQGCVIVSTIDKEGRPHSACKGIVTIEQGGKVYIMDLFKAETYLNIQRSPHISITAVDEHRFKGYCLKGKASIVPPEELPAAIIKDWESRISSRITQRVLKNLREEKGHHSHPEALLPHPEYMIVLEVEEIVDLTPHFLRQGEQNGEHIQRQ